MYIIHFNDSLLLLVNAAGDVIDDELSLSDGIDSIRYCVVI